MLRATQSRRSKLGYAIVLLTACALGLCACSKSPTSNRTSEIQPRPIAAFSPLVAAASTPTPTPATNNPPANPEEVNDAVVRVFNGAAKIDSDRTPLFLIGDFNGDDSQDIAIVVKPSADSLAEINSELSNWTLEDAKAPEQTPKPKTVKAEQTDTLVAIIHGVGAKGWRSQEARQTFLLRNAVGANPAVESAVEHAKDLSPSSRTATPTGQVIRQSVNGHLGLIYWTGARYAWRPTK
jgi:hypothetical protein